MSGVVAGTTVLIYLGKLDDLSLLWELFEEVVIPAPVYDEVVQEGGEAGYRDAVMIASAANDTICVVDLSDDLGETASRLQEKANLGAGEAATITLAREREMRCLTDDHAARTTAESIGVDVGGTIYR